MLRIISDSFKNIVILGGTEPRRGEKGAVSIEMKNFLPNSDSQNSERRQRESQTDGNSQENRLPGRSGSRFADNNQIIFKFLPKIPLTT